MAPVVGLIANPVSARDIRRVVTNAGGLQIADRANIVLRVLAALRACGVDTVLAMPERGGIRAHVERGMARARASGGTAYPDLHTVPMPVTGTVADTRAAAAAMRRAGVAAIVVLGGDGTHRAVAAECGTIPIAGISTGTNNAFPEHREPTVTGLATGLAVTGRVPAEVAFAANKRIDVAVLSDEGEEVREIALVDVALVAQRFVGARALWRPESLRELYVTFADPETIGLSAIAGLLQPVGRDETGGLAVTFAAGPATFTSASPTTVTTLHAPIAPGLVAPVPIAGWRPLPADTPVVPATPAGCVALDGEREIAFDAHQRVSLTLRDGALRTVDVGGCMRHAARHRLLAGAPAPLEAIL